MASDHIKQVLNCPNCNVKKTHYLKWNKNSDFGGGTGIGGRGEGRVESEINYTKLIRLY